MIFRTSSAIVLTTILLLECGTLRTKADDMYFWAEEVGGDVVFYHEGSVDLSGFPSPSSGDAEAFINPSLGILINGGLPMHNIEGYSVLPNGTGRNFGSGLGTAATSESGSDFGLLDQTLFLPPGYGSGTVISGSMTFTGESFASLGLTPTPVTLSTVVGSSRLFLFSRPPTTPPITDIVENGLLKKIRKLKKKSRKLRKKGKKRKAKRLSKKVKELKTQLLELESAENSATSET